MCYLNGQNIGSCHLMLQNVHIGSAPYVGNYVYCLNEAQLELLENIQDLGIQVDSKLNFHAHTILLLKKLTVFWALSVNLLSVKILMLFVRLYTTLICPIMGTYLPI